MKFRLHSEYEYESVVIFRNCPNVPLNRLSPIYHRTLFVFFLFAFPMLSECFQNTANWTRTYRTLSTRLLNECINRSSPIYRMCADFIWILEGFWKRFERVRHVLCLFGDFGKQTVHSGSVREVRSNFRKEYWKGSGYSLYIRRHK